MKFIKKFASNILGFLGKIFKKPNFKSGYTWLVIAGLAFYAFRYYRANVFIGTHGKSADGQSFAKNAWQVFGYWLAEKYSALRDLLAIIMRKKDAARITYDADTNATCDKIKEFFGVYQKGAYTNG